MSVDEEKIPSFADDPSDGLFGFGDDEELETAPPSAKDDDEEEGKKPEAEKTPPAPGARDEDFFARLAAFDEHKRTESEMREQRAREAQEAKKRWEEVYTPPAAPQGEELEKLVLEPEKLLEYFRANQDWTQRALRATANAVAHVRADQERRVNEAVAQATAVAGQAFKISSSVASSLAAEGWPDVESAIAEADETLQTDPEQYLAYRLSPPHFEQAVRYVLHQRNAKPGSREQSPRSNPNVAPGPVLPYTQSAPASLGSSPVGSTPTRGELAKAARAFGLPKISNKTLSKTGRVVL